MAERRRRRMSFSRRAVLELPSSPQATADDDGAGRGVRAGLTARRPRVPAAAERELIRARLASLAQGGRSTRGVAQGGRTTGAVARATPRPSIPFRGSGPLAGPCAPAAARADPGSRVELPSAHRDPRGRLDRLRACGSTPSEPKVRTSRPFRRHVNEEVAETARPRAGDPRARSRLRPEAARRTSARGARRFRTPTSSACRASASRPPTASSTTSTTSCASGCSCRPSRSCRRSSRPARRF